MAWLLLGLTLLLTRCPEVAMKTGSSTAFAYDRPASLIWKADFPAKFGFFSYLHAYWFGELAFSGMLVVLGLVAVISACLLKSPRISTSQILLIILTLFGIFACLTHPFGCLGDVIGYYTNAVSGENATARIGFANAMTCRETNALVYPTPFLAWGISLMVLLLAVNQEAFALLDKPVDLETGQRKWTITLTILVVILWFILAAYAHCPPSQFIVQDIANVLEISLIIASYLVLMFFGLLACRLWSEGKTEPAKPFPGYQSRRRSKMGWIIVSVIALGLRCLMLCLGGFLDAETCECESLEAWFFRFDFALVAASLSAVPVALMASVTYDKERWLHLAHPRMLGSVV